MDTARAHRDQQALREYATHLAPHATGLLDAARRRLDELPVARHTAPGASSSTASPAPIPRS